VPPERSLILEGKDSSERSGLVKRESKNVKETKRPIWRMSVRRRGIGDPSGVGWGGQGGWRWGGGLEVQQLAGKGHKKEGGSVRVLEGDHADMGAKKMYRELPQRSWVVEYIPLTRKALQLNTTYQEMRLS